MDILLNQDHIKRPLNSFMVWAKEKRRMMNRNNPKMRNAEISKILGEEWRKMPESDKQPYVEEALRLRRQHKVDHPNYRYKPRRKQKQELGKERSSFERVAPYPRLISAPMPTTSSSAFHVSHHGPSSYMSNLFPPRFPVDRSPFTDDLMPNTLLPTSMISPYYSSYQIPPTSMTAKKFNPVPCRSDITRVAIPKAEGTFPIAPLPLHTSATSHGSQGVSICEGKPMPYLMLKAEVQYI